MFSDTKIHSVQALSVGFLFQVSVLDLFSQILSVEIKYFNLLQKVYERFLLLVQNLKSRTLKGLLHVLLEDCFCAEP